MDFDAIIQRDCPTPIKWEASRAYMVRRVNDHVRTLEADLAAAQQWVADLQSGMFINCVYCGHRYGPKDEVIKAHVEACPKHPMSRLKAELVAAREMIGVLLTACKAARGAMRSHGPRSENSCNDCCKAWKLINTAIKMGEITPPGGEKCVKL